MNALEIAQPLEPIEQRFRAVLDAFDHMHLGVMIVSPFGAVVCRNLAAERILEQDDGLFLNAAQGLASHHSPTQARLVHALKASSDTDDAEWSSHASALVPVPRKSGEAPYLVEFTPLSNGVMGAGEGCCGAMAFLIDPSDATRFSTRGLKALYNLTDAESEICGLIVDGLTNQEIAVVRHVSHETVKSHVHTLLKKTGTANRSALVRLAVTVSIPADSAD